MNTYGCFGYRLYCNFLNYLVQGALTLRLYVYFINNTYQLMLLSGMFYEFLKFNYLFVCCHGDNITMNGDHYSLIITVMVVPVMVTKI